LSLPAGEGLLACSCLALDEPKMESLIFFIYLKSKGKNKKILQIFMLARGLLPILCRSWLSEHLRHCSRFLSINYQGDSNMSFQQKKQQGFTLIELMIVIAIVGILAAIALPAYQDYTVRAKVSEAMVNLAEAKTTIAEFYSANNYFPANSANAGINTNPNTDIVASIKYYSNYGTTGLPSIGALVKGTIIPNATGTDLYSFYLSGVTASGNRIIWVCKQGTAVYTGAQQIMEAKYLPANCRG
jgi:type IV pilus assembly protein PilA